MLMMMNMRLVTMMMMIIMMIMIMTMVMLMIMATDHGEPEWHFTISNRVAPTIKRINSFLFMTRTRAPTHGQDESRSKEVTR